jgi:hypothetical protein
MRKLSMCLFLFATFVGTQNLDAQKLKGLKDKLNKALAPKPVKGFYQLSKVGNAYEFSQLSDLMIEGDALMQWKYQQGQSINTEQFKVSSELKMAKGISGSFSGSRRPTNWYAVKTADSTFFIIRNDEKQPLTWNYERDKDLFTVISNNEALLKALKDNTDDAILKKNEAELSAVLKSVVSGVANAEKEEIAKREEAMKNAPIADASKFNSSSEFKAIRGKMIAPFVKALADMKIGKDNEKKYIPIYVFSHHSMNSLWTDSKKDVMVGNQVLKNAIIGRLMTVCVVCENRSGEGNKYVYFWTVVTEDCVPGVYDGSKHTGVYYYKGVGQGPLPVSDKDAMKHK